MRTFRAFTSRVVKPEYLFQPAVAFRRAGRALGVESAAEGELQQFVLPWGLPLLVPTEDDHCRMLRDLGVVDLGVTEALWRLSDPDDYVVDAGANIGCMTAVLAARVSAARGGHVVAVEAHPLVRQDLERNVALWPDQVRRGVEIAPAALSSTTGVVRLSEPSAFASNRGLAHVVAADEDATGGIDVPAVTLDDLVPGDRHIGVLKLDVEGHELKVLEGARRLLESGRLRDCVFEDHGRAPTPVMTLLSAHGFDVYRIERRLTGPVLLNSAAPGHTPWLPANYLATRNPVRAQARFYPWGWQCLRGTQ